MSKWSTLSPNYVNLPTRAPAVQVTSIMFEILVTASLALRLYTRGRIKRCFELDDIFATFATDRHTWDIPLKDLHKSQKLGFIYSIVFAEAACQSKLSLLFFARIMIGDFRSNTFYPHYICLYTLVMTVTICQVLFVIVACVECRPLKAAWDPHPTYSYKCFNTSIFIAIVGIINTLTDFLCTILPAFIVFKLQMPLRKRLGISSLFLVGILVNIASVLRIYYLYYENETSDSWNSLPSSVCSNLELGLGLLCVNLPVIRPLITHYKNTSIDYVGYLRSRTGGSKYDPNAYLHSQCSEDFFSVGDDSKPAAVYLSRISAGSGHGPSVYPRSIKANVTTDKVGSLQRVDSI